MIKYLTKEHLFYLIAVAIGAFLFIVPAIYNHYPIFNPDSATYIQSGFMHVSPGDRPLAYGLFIFLFSLKGYSAWTVLYAQGLITSFLIFQVFRLLFSEGRWMLFGLITCFILATSTSLSWVVSEVQPDMFTGIAYLCLALSFIDQRSLRHKWIYYALYFMSMCFHLSHPLLFVLLLSVMFLAKRLFIAPVFLRRSIREIVVLGALAIFSMATMMYPYQQSKHVFFMASLVDKGIVQVFLNEQCGKKKYELCQYKQEIPSDSNIFLWDPNSPLFKVGGWDHSRDNLMPIIHDIVTTPRYLGLFVGSIFGHAWQQAITIGIGDGNDKFGPNSRVKYIVQEYIGREVGIFGQSKQNVIGFQHKLAVVNLFFAILVVISLIVTLTFVVLRWRSMVWQLRTVSMVVFAGIVVNIFDCAAFSVVNGRYGCKTIWMIPFCAILFIMSTIRKQKSTTAPSTEVV